MQIEPVLVGILTSVFAVLVAAVCVWDARTRRIPNQLVVAILTLGVCYGAASVVPWWSGTLHALGGTGVGFAIWVPFYLLGLLGAGDVKFFAAASAWLGPRGAGEASVVAALAGGALALLWLWRRGRISMALTELWISATHPAAAGPSGARASDSGATTASGRRLPYGLAMAAGIGLVACRSMLGH